MALRYVTLKNPNLGSGWKLSSYER